MLVEENDFINYTFYNSILYITIKQNKTPTEEEWNFSKKFMINFYKSVKQSKTLFSMIFDLKNLCILPLKMYQDWANIFGDNKELTEQYLNGTSIINNNSLIKNTLNIFFKIYPTVRPIKLVSSMNDAMTFINESNNNLSHTNLNRQQQINYNMESYQ